MMDDGQRSDIGGQNQRKLKNEARSIRHKRFRFSNIHFSDIQYSMELREWCRASAVREHNRKPQSPRLPDRGGFGWGAAKAALGLWNA